MEEKKLNEKESLELITRMIQNTQHNIGAGSGNPLIVAGLATLLTTALVALLLYFTKSPYCYYIWNIIPLFVWYCFFKQLKRERVTTYFDKIISDIWIVTTAFCTSILVMLFLSQLGEGWDLTLMSSLLCIEILLVSLALGIMSKVIKFPPLSNGAIAGMVLSLSSLTRDEPAVLPYSIMVTFVLWSIATLIIPGVMLNRSIKKSSKC